MRAWPRLKTQHLLLIHLPSLRGVDLFITSSFGMDEPQTFCWDTKRCVCVEGRAGGSRRKRWEELAPLEATSRGGTFLAGMNPFILKSNPHCRKGETVILICAPAISSSLEEREYLLLEPLMEQFASNFPISNNILAANVEWFVRPTHNTDKSLSGGRKGVRGGEEKEEGRVRGERSIRTDHSWLPDESSLQMRLPQSIKRVFVGLERAGMCSAGLVGTEWLDRGLAGSR